MPPPARGDGSIPVGKRLGSETLYGVHLVLAALRVGRRSVREVWIASGREDGKAREIRDLATAQGVRVSRHPRARLDREIPGGVHQGVVAFASPLPLLDEDEILEGCGSRPFLVVLDGVEDPRNLGAIIRSSVAAGVDGMLISARRSAPLGPAAARASAGCSETVRIGRCGNVVALLRRFRKAGIWTVGLDPGAEGLWTEFDYRMGFAMVVGGEGKGLRPLVRRSVDATVRIPMQPGSESLNVSVAAGIALFEAVRQRRLAGPPENKKNISC